MKHQKVVVLKVLFAALISKKSLISLLFSFPPSPFHTFYDFPVSLPLLSHFILPQVHIFSYQCSQLSTPDSVIEVFNTAKRFQRKEDTSKYVSVVVLDEVGLAEDSPNLPLKALHPLLEDGTEGADNKEEVYM